MFLLFLPCFLEGESNLCEKLPFLSCLPWSDKLFAFSKIEVLPPMILRSSSYDPIVPERT